MSVMQQNVIWIVLGKELNMASSSPSLNQKKHALFFFLDKQMSFIVPQIMCYMHRYKNLLFKRKYSILTMLGNIF